VNYLPDSVKSLIFTLIVCMCNFFSIFTFCVRPASMFFFFSFSRHFIAVSSPVFLSVRGPALGLPSSSRNRNRYSIGWNIDSGCGSSRSTCDIKVVCFALDIYCMVGVGVITSIEYWSDTIVGEHALVQPR
jgi:hypothetical protein